MAKSRGGAFLVTRTLHRAKSQNLGVMLSRAMRTLFLASPLLRGFTTSLACNILIAALGFCSGVLAARSLDPAARGELAEIILWGSLGFSLSMLALPTAAVMQIARSDFPARTRSSAVLAALLLSPLATIICLAASPIFVSRGLWFTFAAYAAVTIPAAIIGQTVFALEQQKKNFLLYNASKITPPLIYLILILLLILHHENSARNFVIANAAGSIAVLLMRVGALHVIFRVRPIWRDVAALFKVGASIHAGSILSLLFQRVDQIAVVRLFGHEELGLYAIGQTLAAAISGLVIGALTTAFLPGIAEKRTPAEAAPQIRAMVGATLAVGLCSTLGVLIFAPFVVPTLFGPEYAKAVSISQILAGAHALLGLTSVIALALRLLGDWRAPVLAPICGLASFLLVVAPLQTQFAVDGIALALLVAQALTLLILLIRLAGKLNISILACLFPPVGPLFRRLSSLLAESEP